MYKLDTRTWFSVGFQKILLKTCFSKDRERKCRLEEVYKSHGTLKHYVSQDVQALVHTWGFCYHTLFTSWGLWQQFHSRWLLLELTRTDKRRSAPFQSEMSPIEIDMMIRLTLILEKIGQIRTGFGVKSLWFLGLYKCWR